MSSPATPSVSLPFPNPTNDGQRHANFVASCANVVGAVFGPQPKRWWIPVGLEYANDPANPLPQYRSPFFGADREYEDDEHGWVPAEDANRDRRRAARRANRRSRYN